MDLPHADILNIITAKLIFRILSRLVSQRGSSGAQIFLHFLELFDFVTDCEQSLCSYQMFDIVEVLLEVYPGFYFHP